MPRSDVILTLIADRSGLDTPLKASFSALPEFAITLVRAPELPAADMPCDLAVVDAADPNAAGITAILRDQRGDLPILAGAGPNAGDTLPAMLDAGAEDVVDTAAAPAIIAARLRQTLERSRLAALVARQSEWARGQTLRIRETLRAQEEEIVLRLSLANEMRDNETAEHIVRMARYCVVIAQQLGFPKETCDFLYLAAQMHDIGKIGVPDHILCKAGRLSPDERAIMERHTLVAEKILKGSNSPLIQLAEIIATTHHERWDGTGYPRRLKGSEIPIAGRIAAVADVLDALASSRRYKAGWSLDAARAEIVKHRGVHFDPACVDALLACWGEVEAIAATEPKATTAHQLLDTAVTAPPPRKHATG